MNKVKISSFDLKSTLNPSHRKEALIRSYLLVDEGRVKAEIRVYPSGSAVTACFWLTARGFQADGSAKASGYGYDKACSAITTAVYNAGIEFDRKADYHPESLGDDSGYCILHAIAKKIKCSKGYSVVKTNA